MKLLILGGPRIPAEKLAPLLGGYFDVITVTPQQASEAMLRPEGAALLAEMGDVAPLGRDPVGRQSAMLLNAIGEGVCLCKPDGEVVWANDRFRAMDASLHGRVAAACAQAAKRLASGEAADSPDSQIGPSPRRAEIVSAEGDRFFEIALSPVGADAATKDIPTPEHADHFVAVVWDVTPARRMQQKIESIDRAGRELMRLEADSIRKMNAGERLGFLQDKIVEYARELLHFDHFTIRLLDRESGELNLVMAVGLPQTWKAPELKAAAEGQGIVGYVASTGRSYLCNDTSKDPRYRRGLTSGGSSLTTPLLLHDRIIGVFNVESAKTNAFTDDDRRFAEIFARYMAMALHILDLLVVERFTTNEAVSGRVEGEVTEPLDDLAIEAEWLKRQAAADPEAARHVERVLRDVESIRRRIRDVARGPRTILGAEKALREEGVDPLLVGKRIMVADDEEGIRDAIRDVLERRGCKVTIHKDGAGAIACLEDATQSRASRPSTDDCSRPFDLIISDIKMPDHNGYEVFSAAKMLDPALPVILMTGFGYDPHHSIVRASQEGLQCVLFKPFQVERLLDEVRKAVAAVPKTV